MFDKKSIYLERVILLCCVLVLALIFGIATYGKYESKQVKFSSSHQSYYWVGGPRCNSGDASVATHCRDVILRQGENHGR